MREKSVIRGDFFCIYEKKAVPLPANMCFYEKKLIHTAFSVAIVLLCVSPTYCA